MAEQPARATLSASDGVSTTEAVTVTIFTPAQRARRAGTVMLVGVLCAAALIPIPIIHLLGIPLALVAALVVAARQLRTGARLSRVSLACPRCAAPQLFGGASGLRTLDVPLAVRCDSCRRELTLSIAILPR